MRACPVLFGLLAVRCLAAIDPSVEVARSISTLRLDPNQCYKLTGIDLNKGPISIHLASGWIIFAEPVRGTRPGAVYISSSTGNNIRFAPTAGSERLALDRAVHKTSLNEPFGRSLMLFTDGTDATLSAALAGQHAPKDSAKGAELAQEWASIFAHIADSFHTRIVRDLVGGYPSRGIFYAGVAAPTVGDFDVFYDPSAVDEAVVGKLRDGTFDIIAACCASRPPVWPATVRAYSIDATIHSDQTMSAITKASLRVNASPTRVLIFSLSRLMNVKRAEIDGLAAPVFQSQSLHSNLLRDQGNGEFFLIAPGELKPGSVHEVQIEHEGEVIKRLHNGELLVGARENWYPRTGNVPVRYDLKFHSTPELTLVASGRQTANYLDGSSRVTQWTTEAITHATFNIGRFDHVPVKLNDFTVDTYFPEAPDSPLTDLLPPAGPNYSLAAQNIAQQALSIAAFMTAYLGPVLTTSLVISPVPGPLGQNLSGHVFLPTSVYKDFSDNSRDLNTAPFEERFRAGTAVPHEIAHQWWGVSLQFPTYHDEWIAEALANYSALLYVEQAGGKPITDEAIQHYREALRKKAPDGTTILEAGPVTWGYRLQKVNGGPAWRTITYGKGTLIMHALRGMLGDTAFREFLRASFAEFQSQPVSTRELERIAERYMPGDKVRAFFEACVDGTALP